MLCHCTSLSPGTLSHHDRSQYPVFPTFPVGKPPFLFNLHSSYCRADSSLPANIMSAGRRRQTCQQNRPWDLLLWVSSEAGGHNVGSIFTQEHPSCELLRVCMCVCVLLCPCVPSGPFGCLPVLACLDLPIYLPACYAPAYLYPQNSVDSVCLCACPSVRVSRVHPSKLLVSECGGKLLLLVAPVC